MSIERVDLALCNGCRLCIDTCPMDVIRLDTLPGETSEHPPCRMACPAGVDMRSYINLVKDGMYEEAAALLRESLPFPAITGRLCPHPCESDCARQEVDSAVNINSLERFVGDYSLDEQPVAVPAIYAARVAVVGSGPAGLSCAYFLARQGFSVTIFEAMSEPGGMLRQAIPEYRLPLHVLDSQIAYLKGLGVEFKTGVAIGKDVELADLNKTHQAVFWATGNQLSAKIDVPGSELSGVLWGLDFLRDVRLNGLKALKGQVVVIGGGNVAIDVALTAVRLGASGVQLACLETPERMPAYEDEIQQAAEEGVVFHTSWGPSRVLESGGRVAGVEFVRCTSVCDATGAFAPTYDPTTTKVLEAGTVIFAIGQSPDTAAIPAGVMLRDNRTMRVHPLTMETSVPGLFAGGDIVSGPSTVISAIADGKRAAISIERYLRGEDMTEGRSLVPDRVKDCPGERIPKMTRQEARLLPLSERTANFGEVRLGFDEDTTRLESQRCMTCGSKASINYVDDCQLCLYCERDCPQKAITVSPARKVDPMLAWG